MRAKASAAKVSKPSGKGSNARRKAPTERRAVAALDSSLSLAERIQAQREQLFKVISIVQCCRNAMATKLLTDDLEYMIPAFEAVCELVDSAAGELDCIAYTCRS